MGVLLGIIGVALIVLTTGLVMGAMLLDKMMDEDDDA